MIEAILKTEVIISPNRQRKDKDPEYTVELANSIERNGLIHPITVRRSNDRVILVAGEQRSEAIEYLWNMGSQVRCGGKVFPEGQLPCIDLKNLNPIDAFEIELEENIRRRDLSWQEKSTATSQLFELRRLQAEKAGKPVPTVAEIAKEIRGDSGGAHERTRKEIIVSKHLADEDVSKAKTVDEAFKVIKRKEELQKSAELGRSVGLTFNNSAHSLLRGDCLELLKTLPSESFDCILTDPPYGIDAQDYNSSGGKAGGGGSGSHFYDDSPETWVTLMKAFLPQICRLAKPQAHFYMFCDVDNFWHAKQLLQIAIFDTRTDWKIFRTPLIFINPTAIRAPWPDQGPQRKWQMILYAVKGSKHVNHLRPDVLTYPSDDNLNHHAQKPVALYTDLLSRSCNPGDSVLDPFCGTGTIFPSAHELKVRATGIELDESAYGIAVKRLEGLK